MKAYTCNKTGRQVWATDYTEESKDMVFSFFQGLIESQAIKKVAHNRTLILSDIVIIDHFNDGKRLNIGDFLVCWNGGFDILKPSDFAKEYRPYSTEENASFLDQRVEMMGHPISRRKVIDIGKNSPENISVSVGGTEKGLSGSIILHGQIFPNISLFTIDGYEGTAPELIAYLKEFCKACVYYVQQMKKNVEGLISDIDKELK